MLNDFQIPNYHLTQNGEIVQFSIRTMEEIDEAADGQSNVPHRHNYYTIIWVHEAYGVHHIDFRDYNVEPDTIFFIHPQQVHQLEIERNPKGVVILFTCDFLMSHGIREDFISNLNLFLTCDENPPIPVPRESKPVLQHITDNIFNEFKSDNVFRFEAISAQLNLFLIECNRISNLTRVATQPDFHNHTLIKEFKKLVEQNFRSQHKVSYYSEQLHITAKHLNEVIKASIGRTAKEYILDRILLEAKRTAHFTDLSSKQIAFQLGFNDPAHFSKLFKKCQGISFTEYKAQIR
jgi:AraC-like DNA-binding protein